MSVLLPSPVAGEGPQMSGEPALITARNSFIELKE